LHRGSNVETVPLASAVFYLITGGGEINYLGFDLRSRQSDLSRDRLNSAEAVDLSVIVIINLACAKRKYRDFLNRDDRGVNAYLVAPQLAD